MKATRREALLSGLLGLSGLGLRALATGLPASFLLNPARALADGLPMCGDRSKAQFFIFATSGQGDPLNANVPGCYADPKISHSLDPAMAATAFSLGSQQVIGALPWSTFPQAVRDRMSFWHLKTNTPVHPKEPDVLGLMGAIRPAEMFPSLLAKQLAACLGTVQAQPMTLGATSPSEGLSYGGGALPILPPLSLKATLLSPAGPLGTLQALRDQTLDQLSGVLRTSATRAQKNYLDALITSQAQVRGIRQDLLSAFDSITDNSAASQITAAVALIQMKVTPVLAVHIPFGGDNHNDTALATETAQTVSGVGELVTLMQKLTAAGLADQVSVISLNVFGRTLGPGNTDGRQHNPNHQVSLAIGKPFRPGVVGGVTPLDGDYSAMGLDSATGAASAAGDVPAIDTLASFGKTVLAAVGVDSATVEYAIPAGKVIRGMLA
jgi:hypothetical protein